MTKEDFKINVLYEAMKGQNPWRIGAIILFLFFSIFVFQWSWAEDTAEDELHSIHEPLVTKSLLLDITKTSNLHFIAVGERGHIVYSYDGGNKWKQATVPTRSTLTSVFFLNSKLGWAVGHDAVILTTSDGGKSWTRQFYAPDKEQPFMAIWFQDERFGIAIGAYGMYFDTTDGGENWNNKYYESLDDPDFGLPHFNDIGITPEKVLYITGEAGFVARSNNMGESWTPLDRSYNGSYFSLLVTKENTLFSAGLRGNIWFSKNQAATWEKIETGSVASVNSGIQLSNGDTFFVCMDGVTVHCQNGGETHKVNLRSDRVAIASVVEKNPNHLIAVGEKGIMHIGLDGQNIEP
ncbi:BNR/Asp-box repeat-containing protein [Candidatus Magnetomorum sp. HK-1]|nr:BNR/Asp-box repeat-containing protein [Candidatus Magnetomorum sp. HK-1]